MEFSIVQADISNIDDIKDIGATTFYQTFIEKNNQEDITSYIKESFTTEVVQKEIENHNSTFYLAKDKDKVIGYLKLNIGDAQTEEGYDNTLEIQRIYILNDYKKKKIGKTLMEKSIQIAKDKNFDYIWLGVWSENTPAIKFYESFGFKIFANHTFVVGSDPQEDYLMKLDL